MSNHYSPQSAPMPRERGDNGMLAAIANNTTPAREWKEIDVLADNETNTRGEPPFPESIAYNDALVEAWSEYQAHGFWNREAKTGIGPLVADQLRAHGAAI